MSINFLWPAKMSAKQIALCLRQRHKPFFDFFLFTFLPNPLVTICCIQTPPSLWFLCPVITKFITLFEGNSQEGVSSLAVTVQRSQVWLAGVLKSEWAMPVYGFLKWVSFIFLGRGALQTIDMTYNYYSMYWLVWHQTERQNSKVERKQKNLEAEANVARIKTKYLIELL